MAICVADKTTPSKCDVVPMLTWPATCQNTFFAFAPPDRNTEVAEAISTFCATWKIQTSLALPASVMLDGISRLLVQL